MSGDGSETLKSKQWRNVGNPFRSLMHLQVVARRMGGGKKKTTLKKMEKASTRKSTSKEEKPSKPSKRVAERKIAGIVSPDAKSEKVLSELKKLKVLTPYTVASRFDLRLGVARGLLQELEKQRVVEFVSGSKNLKIYKHAN